MTRGQIVGVVLLLLIPGAGCEQSVEAPEEASLTEEEKRQEEARQAITRLGIQYSEHAFLESARTGNTQVVKHFIAAGMDLSAKDRNGWTALIVAAAEGHADTVKALADGGADLKATDPVGNTALTWAKNRGHTNVVKLLQQVGAKDPEERAEAQETSNVASSGCPCWAESTLTIDPPWNLCYEFNQPRSDGGVNVALQLTRTLAVEGERGTEDELRINMMRVNPPPPPSGIQHGLCAVAASRIVHGALVAGKTPAYPSGLSPVTNNDLTPKQVAECEASMRAVIAASELSCAPS